MTRLQVASVPQARGLEYRNKPDRIAAAAMRPFRRLTSAGLGHSTTMWAVKDVTYDIPRGEVVGLIGGNGAGKSTLLKLLSRITEPTAGEAEIHGGQGQAGEDQREDTLKRPTSRHRFACVSHD